MASNLIKIKSGSELIAIIIRAQFQPQPHQFLTDKNNPLQLGILSYPKNSSVKPHRHRRQAKTSHQNQEFIFVKSGLIKAAFFHQNTLLAKHTLYPGDCLLQLSGGHGFQFLKPTQLITIKQGPYRGRTREKELLAFSSTTAQP